MLMDIHSLAMMTDGYQRDHGVGLLKAYEECVEMICTEDDREQQPTFKDVKQYLFDWNREHGKDDN